MNLFKKLFCGHKWKTHDKKTYEWEGYQMVKGTKHWYHPKLELHQFSETIEILICPDCGKVKILKY